MVWNDVWNDVEGNAVINHPELGECTLHHNGDLWIIPVSELDQLED